MTRSARRGIFGAMPLLFSVYSFASSRIVTGPYLQNVTPCSIVIMWETDTSEEGRVDYGESDRFGNSIPSRGKDNEKGTYIHEVILEGLRPGTLYHYQVSAGGGDGQNGSFRTAPQMDRPFRFVVWGDNQNGNAVFSKLSGQMGRFQPDLLLSVGDVVHRGTTYSLWRKQLFKPLSELARHVPFFVACGNHESYTGRNNAWFDQYLSAPGNEHYFSFDYGGSHFIVLDNAEGHTRYGLYPFHEGTDQYDWLLDDLQGEASRDAAFRFVFLHVPPYSWSPGPNGSRGDEGTRRHLVPLFQKYGVDIVFAGHHHKFERGRWPVEGYPAIQYVVTGGGGGNLFSAKSQPEDGWDQIQNEIYGVNHFCVVDVNARQLDFRAIDIDGKELDSFSIGQEAPLPPENIRVGSLSGAVQLLWETNHLNDEGAFSGVAVYRSDRQDGGYKEIARVDERRGYFADEAVSNGQSYYYRLASLEKGSRSSAKSAPIKASPSSREMPLSSIKRLQPFSDSLIGSKSFDDWTFLNVDFDRFSPPEREEQPDELIWQLSLVESSKSGTVMSGIESDRNYSVEGTLYCRRIPRAVRTFGSGCAPAQESGMSTSESPDTFDTPVVISQVHTGTHAFVELHNRTDEDIVLRNWSLQGFQTGNRDTDTGQWGHLQGALLALNVGIPANGYYLVGIGAESIGREIRPDVMWPKAISRAGFQIEGASVALVRNNRPLSNEISGGALADLVGWGTARYFEGSRPAPAPAESQSIVRRAKRNSTPASMNDGGADALESNAFDSGENFQDFIVRESPSPRNSAYIDRFSVTGIFLRDDGEGKFVDGNCYYLVWNPVEGCFHAGTAVNGARREFEPHQIFRLQDSGWHNLRIAADGKVITFWVDDTVVARVLDDTHQSGRCGVGLRLAVRERNEEFSTLLRDFAIHARDTTAFARRRE
jgi:hypothetical protein